MRSRILVVTLAAAFVAGCGNTGAPFRTTVPSEFRSESLDLDTDVDASEEVAGVPRDSQAGQRWRHGACWQGGRLLTVINVDVYWASYIRVLTADPNMEQHIRLTYRRITLPKDPVLFDDSSRWDDPGTGTAVRLGDDIMSASPPHTRYYRILVWARDASFVATRFRIVAYGEGNDGLDDELAASQHYVVVDDFRCADGGDPPPPPPPPAPEADVTVALPPSFLDIAALITNAVPGGTGNAGGVLAPFTLEDSKPGAPTSAEINVGGSVDLLWSNTVIEAVAVERTRSRSHFAFTSRDTRFVGGPITDANPDLFVGVSATGEARRLTTFRDSGLGVGWFAWSPDGTRIACTVHTALGIVDIYVVDATTGTASKVAGPYTTALGPVSGMTWSPTGGRIAYSIESGLYVLDLATGTAIDIFGAAAFEVDWHPTDERIAYTRDNALWTINADGTGVTQVLTGYDGITLPRWSPDGSRIAMGYNADAPFPGSIAIYDPAGDVLTIYDDTGYAFYLDW